MKYIDLLFCLFIYSSNICAVNVNARAVKHVALPILLLAIGVAQHDQQAQELFDVIKKNLSFTQQFSVDVHYADKVVYSKWQKQYPIIIVIEPKEDLLTWKLFDVTQKKVINQGEIKKREHQRAYAHIVADILWQELTGSPGFFSTRIAYCKEVKGPKERTLKHICIADYDGMYEQVLVDTPTVNIAPRWNADLRRPLLFYSEFTDKNVCMMYVDMKKRRHIACNFDGVNMLPAFSQDGTKAVFCASQGKGNPQLFYIQQGKVKQLTKNSGNNFCPTLNESGDIIYFCSDCNLKRPSIFTYDMKLNRLDRIANTASSESPCYCPQNKKLAYCRSIKGVMQICIYDTVAKKHQQLTFDNAAKQGVSWSPCGNYLVFVHEIANTSCLCMMNIPTRKIYYLSKKGAKISYPVWSPRYVQYPVI
ncbi:MAG: hypothetical protein WD055_03175 [Candidatus Dependentiae bacterium]